MMAAQNSKTKRAMAIKLTVLGMMSAANLLLILYVMPNFEQIYRDALPGWPLPSVTSFILNNRVFLGLFAVAWLVAGLVLVRRENRRALIFVRCGMLWCFLQAGFTVYALFVPMVGLHIGMSDAPEGK